MTGEIQKWADTAMYRQDEIDTEAGPRVSLLWMTPDPLGAMAAMNGMYPGPHHVVPQSLADITRKQREAVLEDMRKTILAVPLEAVNFHFVIEGVTRAFTHQLVRNRTSSFAQESMRFAVVGDGTDGIPVMLPPSLAGTKSYEQWSADNPSWAIGDYISDEQKARNSWDIAMMDLGETYKDLIDAGMPAEDARGILPTNVLTRIQWVVNLRSLQNEFGKRLSTQAQFEWRRIVALCAQAIREYDPYKAFTKTFEGWGESHETDIARDVVAWAAESDRWQYEAIADLFRPICYKTGKCEFMASADRFCSIRSRVQENAGIGRPSSEWDKEWHGTDPNSPTGAEGFIAAIHPAEWLADATAARRPQ